MTTSSSSQNILYMFIVFIILMFAGFVGVHVWVDRQVQQGLSDLQSQDGARFQNGQNRLLGIGSRAIPKIVAAVEKVKPGKGGENRSVAGDQLYWRAINVLGQIGDVSVMPKLNAWMLEDEMDSFQAGSNALAEIALRNPDSPQAQAGYDMIMNALMKTNVPENVEPALSILAFNGNGKHAEQIIKMLLENRLHLDAKPFLVSLEKIAQRGRFFDVGKLKESKDRYVRVICGRTMCYMGQEEGLDLIADVFKDREQIRDSFVLFLAGTAFDNFTKRNLNYKRMDSKEKREEKIENYLKFYDEHRSRGETMLQGKQE